MGARPADDPTNPSIYDPGATYTVGWFHAHTPTTYRPIGRPVGPSVPDETLSNSVGLPGIAYDYVAASGGAIPAGYPLNMPAQPYPVVRAYASFLAVANTLRR